LLSYNARLNLHTSSCSGDAPERLVYPEKLNKRSYGTDVAGTHSSLYKTSENRKTMAIHFPLGEWIVCFWNWIFISVASQVS